MIQYKTMNVPVERLPFPTLSHNHDTHEPHNHPEQTITLSEGKKKTIRGLQLGSFGLQAAGTAWEVLQNGWSALNTRILLLMAHDANDVAGWELDLRQDRGELSEKARQRAEKMAHWAIASGGAYTAAEGGAAAMGMRWHEGSHNMLNMVAATGATGVAAATTGLVVTGVIKRYGSVKKLWQHAREGDSETIKDKKRLMHGATDFLTAGAVMADTTEFLSSQSSGALAALGGLACMVYFRPTKKNLEQGHVCAAHDHSHHNDHHTNDNHRHDKKESSRWRRRAKLGAFAAAIAIGATVTVPMAVSQQNNAPVSVVEAPTQQAVTIQQGDTLWSLVRDYAHDVTGEAPSERTVYELAQEAARLNSALLPNPHLIYPNSTLVLPTEDSIQTKMVYT